jgi:hypothetical protein
MASPLDLALAETHIDELRRAAARNRRDAQLLDRAPGPIRRYFRRASQAEQPQVRRPGR